MRTETRNQTKMVDEEQAKLIRLAKNGDVMAFNELILLHQKTMYNIALRMMGNEPSAEDMTQDAFVRAYKRIGTLRDNNFRAWMKTIVVNRCLDELRKHKRTPQSSIEEKTEENESASFLEADDETPEQAAERADLRKRIESCLEGLSADQRAMVILCDMYDYSYNEISETLNIKVGTVRSGLSRARARLRGCMSRTER